MISLGLSLAINSNAQGPPTQKKQAGKKTASSETLTLKNGQELHGLILGKNRSGQYCLLVQKSWLKKSLPEQAEKLFQEEAARVEKAAQTLEKLLDEWIQESEKEGKPSSWVKTLQEEKKNLRSRNPAQEQFLLVDIKPSDVKKKTQVTPAVRHLLLVAWQERLENIETRSAEELLADLKESKIDFAKEKIRLTERMPSMPVETGQDWLTRKALFAQAREGGLHLQGTGDFLTQGGKKDVNLMELFQGAGKSALADVFKELGIGGQAKQNPTWHQTAARLASEAKVHGVRVTRMTPDLAGGKVSLEDHFFVRLPNNLLVPVWSGNLAANMNIPRPKLEEQIRSDPNVAAMIKQIEGLGGLGAQIGPQLTLAIRGGAATMELYDQADTAFLELLKQTSSRLDGLPLYWILK